MKLAARFCCLLCVCLLVAPASADVAVLANRTVAGLTVDILRAGGLPESVTIPVGDSQAIFFQRALTVRFGDSFQQQQYPLKASCAYFFTRGSDGNTLHLEEIGLGEVQSVAEPPAQQRLLPITEPVTVTVKLLVDDDEPTHQRIWEAKFRQRIAEASAILERHSGVRLKVVAVETWESDDKQQNFYQTLAEFERKVKPAPAQLAIGFSSQYQATLGRTHLGVTRAPLHSHILLREQSRNLLEAERLELLVHELGHYLGASHSPEPQSVMRPLLTRGPQRGVGARIQFDPVNALLIALTGDEIRQREVREISDFSKPTIARMKQIYGVLQQALPRDPAARQMQFVLNRLTAPQQVVSAQRQTVEPNASIAPLVRDTRMVLGHLQTVAAQQQEGDKLTGDELTNLYVRQAALAASRIRSANAPRAMLLALGIFVDDSDTLRSFPGTSTFISQVESDDQRADRIRVLGKPTMRERSDLLKHFFVSAHLVVVGGKQATASAGLAKEMLDSNGGTGFSFVDMAANRAGIVFAGQLLEGRLSLSNLARDFHVDNFLPTLVGLDEGLTATALSEQYGGSEQQTIAEALTEIEQRVLSLPIYDQPE